MKSTKTKTAGRNRSRLAGFQNYSPYSPTYIEADILDTDEAKVMKQYSRAMEDAIDILDSDEGIIIQYYKGSFNKQLNGTHRERIHA